MTTVVYTVCMIVARFAALVTYGDDVLGDALAQALVEDEVLSNELTLDSFFFDFLCVLDDAAVELKYIFKTDVFHPGAGLFAADAAGAIHQEVFVLLVAHQIFGYLQLFAERVYVGKDGALEVANLAFVVIAHVDDDGVRVIG